MVFSPILTELIRHRGKFLVAHILALVFFSPLYFFSIGIVYVLHEIIFHCLCGYRIHNVIGGRHLAIFGVSLFFSRPFYFLLDATVDTDSIPANVGGAIVLFILFSYFLVVVYVLCAFLVKSKDVDGFCPENLGPT